MNQNRKFERAARSRSQTAFILAIVLHAIVFAAIVYSSELDGLVPDFLKDLFPSREKDVPTASLP